VKTAWETTFLAGVQWGLTGLYHAFSSVPGLEAIGWIRAERRIGTEQSIEDRYYLLSHPLAATTFAAAVRSHWGIENRVHWVLDMTFHQDQSRIRAGHAAENVAVLRQIALNLLRQQKTKRTSIKAPHGRLGYRLSSSDPHQRLDAFTLSVLGQQGGSNHQIRPKGNVGFALAPRRGVPPQATSRSRVSELAGRGTATNSHRLPGRGSERQSAVSPPPVNLLP